MSVKSTISRFYICFDNDEKIVCRVYGSDNGLEEWKLCKIHSLDPEYFDGFISEEKF